MLAWFFGLHRMIQVVTYVGAIFGAIVAGAHAWEVVKPLLTH